jgi:hypothetical protein
MEVVLRIAWTFRLSVPEPEACRIKGVDLSMGIGYIFRACVSDRSWRAKTPPLMVPPTAVRMQASGVGAKASFYLIPL